MASNEPFLGCGADRSQRRLQFRIALQLPAAQASFRMGGLIDSFSARRLGCSRPIAPESILFQVPAGVEHGADVLADAIGVEAFSPIRDHYPPKAT
ncbi:MAG: hypothetical protein AB9869_10380 [Verrucomicrobiia bacterium]